MADVVEITGPPAVDQSGNLTIWYVKTLADVTAPKLTEIGAITSFRHTHSFTPDGWNLTGSQTKSKDERLTLRQALESLESSEVSLSLKYVDSATPGSAAVVLKEGESGYFVERRNVAQSKVATLADKVRVIPVTLGKQIPGPVDGTGKFTYTQEVAITGVIGEEVALVA
ncbi:MAG: hypothetical protein ABWX92_18265 [Mycetocola sp.]